MEVRLFKVGGHEYVFSFGIVRKGAEETNIKENLRNIRKFSRVPVLEIPINKYGYNRKDISKNIGLKNYAKIMDKMPDILEYITEEPIYTNIIVDKLTKEHIIDIKVNELNNISRIHESNPLEDSAHKKWLLVNSGWGVNSKISKKEVKK